MGKRAARHAAEATPSRPDGRLAAPDARPLPNQSYARIAVLATLLLLAIYTALALERLSERPVPVDPAAAAIRAEALAAGLDAEAAALRGAMSAAAAILDEGGSPRAAAAAALSAGDGAVATAAVTGPTGVEAMAGLPAALDSAVAAAPPGARLWIGLQPGPSPALAGAAVRGERRILVAGSASRLQRLLQARPGAGLVTPDGRRVAGAEPHSTDVSTAAHPALGGQVRAWAAAPPARPVPPAAREVIWLIAPLGAAFLLGLLLLQQSRRVERAQQSFVAAEQRFRRAVEAARCGIWEWDLENDRMFMSDVTGAILGWGGGGMVDGAKVIARVSPDHQERLKQALTTASAYGAFDVSFRVPSLNGGRPVWVDARGQAFGHANGEGFSRIIGVALDVTEERMAQARAQAAESRLRDAIESLSDGFVLWDRSGRLLMCNRNYRSFFSLEPRLLKPGALRDQVNRLAELAIVQELPAPDGRPGVREAELKDGRWIQIVEHRTAEGGLVMLATDITASRREEEARRYNEEQLQRAVVGLERSQEQLSELARKYEAEKVRAESANRAKSEFLANMSHELRTPLNAINGFSEIMVGEMFGPLGDKRYKEYAQDILNSGQHLLALINDILDMSKIEAGKLSLKFEPLTVEDVALDAVRLVRHRADAAGLSVILEIPSTLPDVEADYRAVKQVLLNLLSNAIKFTPRGGRIVIGAELRSDPLGARVRMSVRDTGIGIADEDLQRLATPFEQIENQHSKTTQGTGLGLALTKSLVEMHGGALDLRSTPGQGTTVSFSLPVQQSGLQYAAPGYAVA